MIISFIDNELFFLLQWRKVTRPSFHQQHYDEMDEENMETVVDGKRKQDQELSTLTAPFGDDEGPGTNPTYGYV